MKLFENLTKELGNEEKIVETRGFEGQKQYFSHIGKREKYKTVQWYVPIRASTEKQRKFLHYLEQAFEKINYDFWIATIEPSKDEKGKLFFENGGEVAVGMNAPECEIKAKQFAPEYESDLATVYELFLWYGYRLAMGYWNISYVCDDLMELYSNLAEKKLDMSGDKNIGGAKDGIRNTAKIVKIGEDYAVVGDAITKDNYTKSMTKVEVIPQEEILKKQNFASPVVVLKKQADF